MKRLMSLVLLLAVVGIAAANIPMQRVPSRQPHNTALLNFGLQGWQGMIGPLVLGLINRNYWSFDPGYRGHLRRDLISAPPFSPVCYGFCPIRPVRGIGE